MGRLTVAAAIGQAALGAKRRWKALPAERRNRLQALLRQSAGRPSNLSASERRELQTIVAELNLGDVVRQSATRASRRRFFRR